MSKIDVFGTHFDLHRDYEVATMLWLPALYWLVRYYQVMHDLGSLGFRDAQRNRLIQLIPIYALKKYATQDLLSGNAHGSISKRTRYAIEHVERTYISAPHGYASEIVVSWSTPTPNGPIRGRTSGPTRVELTHDELKIAKIRAWLHVLINTTKVTEYVLPLILFAVPVLQWIFAKLP